MKIARNHGQPFWRISSDKVEAVITRKGGHLAPVRFRLPHATIEPFSIAPWAEDKLSAQTPEILRLLRGDFFCAPFGENETPWRGEKHPAHGETAQAPWRLESIKKSKTGIELHLSLRTKIRAGRVDKKLRLRRGETVLYCQHIISEMTGKMNFGHHATLKFPDQAGSGLISMSPIHFGQVLPSALEEPTSGGYSCLKPGALFSRLDHVPTVDGGLANLSWYPDRPGFEDLVMVAHKAASSFAWTAVTFPEQRHVWFALKDPRVLSSTVLWCSNGGRHYAPWNGRHLSVLGIEDVTSYFHYGLAESARANRVNRRGIPTCLTLKKSTPLVVNYIMAVAAIPRGWGRVASITPDQDGVTLLSEKESPIRVSLDFNFLHAKA